MSILRRPTLPRLRRLAPLALGLVAPVMLLLAGALEARAGSTLAGQARSHSIDTSGTNTYFNSETAQSLNLPFEQSGAEAAPDTGPFHSQLDLDWGFASQHSRLTAQTVEATGRVISAGRCQIEPFYYPPYDTVVAVADTLSRSDLSATFEIDTPTPYTIESTLEGTYYPSFYFDGPALVSVSLTGPGGSLFQSTCNLDFNVTDCPPFSEQASGVLAPGTYTVDVHAEALGESADCGPGGFGATYGRLDYAFSLQIGGQPVPGLAPGALAALTALLGVSGVQRTLRSRR